jgi:peptidoglycan/xylan/chitin deacetylase (PgdA/CDA1 family)
LLTAAKRQLFASARTLGVINRVADSSWRQRRLMILCYHGTALDDEYLWNGDLFLSQERLRERCALLAKERYQVLPLDESVRRLHEGTLPRRAVTITFDDGTHDFHARALPVLREFGFPATVYVTTYYSRVRCPVFAPMVAYLAWKGRAAGSISPKDLVPGDEPLSLIDRESQRRTAARINQAAATAGLDAAQKDALARRFAERMQLDYDALVERRILHIMTAEQIAEVARSGVDVQLHTHRHRMPEDRALFLREIEDNRRALTAAVPNGEPLRHFCYPSGVYAPAFVPWMREADIGTAVTCDPALATAESDPLQLPRFIDTMGNSADVFRAWISGFAELLPRRTRRAAGARP